MCRNRNIVYIVIMEIDWEYDVIDSVHSSLRSAEEHLESLGYKLIESDLKLYNYKADRVGYVEYARVEEWDVHA